MTTPQQQQQPFKLAVKPGTPAAVRRQELDNAVFMDVRLLAYMVYKNPDQTPLMTYAETLDHRGMVKQKLLQFEVANGWVTPDGTETQPFSDTNPNVDTGAQMSQQPPMMPPGMPMMPQQPQQMQMPMMPQQQPPQSMMPMMASPAQVAQVPQQPMMAPPGMGLPGVPSMPAYAPPMQAAPPQTMQPQVASPAQAAEAAQQQPVAAAPGKRRGRGSQVAAPPPPPPAGAPPQQMQMMAPPQQQQQMAPPQQFAPPPGMMPQQPMQQVPVQNFPPQQQQQQAAPPPQAAGLEKVLADLGRGLEVLSKNNMELNAKLDAVTKELADTKMLAAQALGALHHIYIMGPPGQNAQGQANDLPSFQNFLGKYLGNIGKPNPK